MSANASACPQISRCSISSARVAALRCRTCARARPCLLGAGPGARKIKWKHAGTLLSAADRDLLRFEQKNGMLRNILSPAVPPLAARHAEELLNKTLAEAGVARSQIAQWIWHAGGRDVLLAMRERLGLSAEQVGHSAAVLREFGNVSSP